MCYFFLRRRDPHHVKIIAQCVKQLTYKKLGYDREQTCTSED